MVYPLIDWEEEEGSEKKKKKEAAAATTSRAASPAAAAAAAAPASLSLVRSLEQAQLEDEAEALRLRRARMESPMYVCIGGVGG